MVRPIGDWGSVMSGAHLRMRAKASQRRQSLCSCKVRMSGLCKVEMSAFLGAGGPDGRGADRVERARAGAVEGVARDYTRASAADRGRTPFAVERSAGAAIAAA